MQNQKVWLAIGFGLLCIAMLLFLKYFRYEIVCTGQGAAYVLDKWKGEVQSFILDRSLKPVKIGIEFDPRTQQHEEENKP